MLRLLRTTLLAALQVPCSLVVALSLVALLMYNRAQRRTLLLDFALYKAPEECRASWERYYQGLEDYKVRSHVHVAALWQAWLNQDMVWKVLPGVPLCSWSTDLLHRMAVIF